MGGSIFQFLALRNLCTLPYSKRRASFYLQQPERQAQNRSDGKIIYSFWAKARDAVVMTACPLKAPSPNVREGRVLGNIQRRPRAMTGCYRFSVVLATAFIQLIPGAGSDLDLVSL